MGIFLSQTSFVSLRSCTYNFLFEGYRRYRTGEDGKMSTDFLTFVKIENWKNVKKEKLHQVEKCQLVLFQICPKLEKCQFVLQHLTFVNLQNWKIIIFCCPGKNVKIIELIVN